MCHVVSHFVVKDIGLTKRRDRSNDCHISHEIITTSLRYELTISRLDKQSVFVIYALVNLHFVFLLQKWFIYIRIESGYSRNIPQKVFTNIIEMQTVSYLNRCFTDVESSVCCQLL